MEKDEKMILIRQLVDDITEDIDEEEVLHMILERKISADLDLSGEGVSTFGQKAADSIAHFAGSWTFIFTFTMLLVGWMTVNAVLAARAFDAYPYVLLNLVLSCIAAVQAPLIMMSQNRQEEKDRKQAENSYKLNLKSEFILEDIHKKLDRMISDLEEA